MKIGQVQNFKGNVKNVFVINKEGVYILNSDVITSTRNLIDKCDQGQSLSDVIQLLLNQGYGIKIAQSEKEFLNREFKLLRPVDPPEAWAVGVTYKRQAQEHDKDLQKQRGKYDNLYTYAYGNERAEVFFKGLSRTIVGSGEDLWLRPDSKLVMPEAEVVLVIGKGGGPVGFTLGNDLTAWDIESECPLYLNQAKIWTGSGSIGPYIVPCECSPGPYSFDLRCVVMRKRKMVLDVSGSTSGLKRSIEELCYFLNFANQVESGTVFYTGTTCVIDHEFSLKEGDIVEVSCPIIGALTNRVAIRKFPERNYTIREEGKQ